MTTIAYRTDQRVMACDSCWTHDELIAVCASKIHRLKSGGLLGQAGDNDSRRFVLMLDKVTKYEQLPTYEELHAIRQDFCGLFVMPCGRAFILSTAFRIDKAEDDDEIGLWEVGINPPFAAVGSGKEAAMVAMRMGADARRAVAEACAVDTNSRAPIHSAALGQVKKPAKPKKKANGRRNRK